jgi:hypothetical protein
MKSFLILSLLAISSSSPPHPQNRLLNPFTSLTVTRREIILDNIILFHGLINYKAVLRIRIRIHVFLGLMDPDPDPLVTGMDPAPDPDPSIIKQK